MEGGRAWGSSSEALANLPKDSGTPEPQHFCYGLLIESRNHLLVTVAQLAEHRVVVPKVAGSSPVGHPSKTPAKHRTMKGIWSRPETF